MIWTSPETAETILGAVVGALEPLAVPQLVEGVKTIGRRDDYEEPPGHPIEEHRGCFGK